ncbi:cupredoxin domain-containing protein [Paenibacillus filicis]|uniref:Cupredoxin domain-containing protein n=1 Tax=Paenibacillus filicis TaxID=669464 RepID=A0ABU9DNY4_9BACL
MLSIISMGLVMLLTGYSVFYTYKQKEKLSCMAGMMIAMTVGMMSSLALGVLLGVALNHDLTLSTILSILFGMGVGYLTGKPVSLMAALDGMMAGVMGGMMGAMLGVMLVVSDVMVIFVDVIFIFIMSVLIQLIEQESGKTKEARQAVGKRFVGSLSALILGMVLVAVLLVVQYQGTSSVFGAAPSTSAGEGAASEETAGYEIVNIQVSATGYAPKDIEVKAGVPTKINFIANSARDCTATVEFEKLNKDVQLKKGNNYVDLGDLKPGVYDYHCRMYMYGGKITVKA